MKQQKLQQPAKNIRTFLKAFYAYFDYKKYFEISLEYDYPDYIRAV